jgi:hypothetical protein
LTAGPRDSPARFFAPPPDVPKAASGLDYPLDWWTDIAKSERRGLRRYDNALPPALIRRSALQAGCDQLVLAPQMYVA